MTNYRRGIYDAGMASGTVDLDGLLDELRATQLPPPALRRRIREKAGLSARRLARALGVATSTLLAWEEGATPHPAHARLYREALDALESA